MTIAERTLSILEYPKVRERLAQHTSFSASRELALSLRPDDDATFIRHAQRATSAARQLFDTFPDITIGGARDIRQSVAKSLRGGILEPEQLLEVSATLRTMRQLRVRLFKLPPEPYAPLRDIALALPELPSLEDAIEHTVDPGGNILDSASPTLGKIRSEIRVAHSRLLERLNGIIGSSQYAGALQEPIVTMRDGRYVVPIKATGRRTLQGIVHDQSNTGATLFVEPLQTVELNNRWRELQLAEQQEITRILQMLSARIAEQGDNITTGVEALAELDLLFAKGRYSAALNCIEPTIVDGLSESDDPEPPLHLRRARHPLLDQTTVVPTDVWLGKTFRVLLITGPNTGGKTVALKTTGLLALMAQSGLHIPAADRSRLPVFQHIFADIGDEQSIEQSLSTFSSHMTHIIAILRTLDQIKADRTTYGQAPSALVLFDELGAGTDPTEGAALARAIIERVLESGALCIGTTHYAELKAYAHNTPGVENASVAFDEETLRPAYRLEIGLPGRSNALAIASRLGLQPELIDRARSFLSAEEEQVEEMLTSIARQREAAATEQQQAEQERAAAEHLRAELQNELAQLELERDQRLQAFERELDDELKGIRQELRRLRDDTRSVSLTREWMQQAEERLKSLGETADRQRQQRRRERPAQLQPAQQAPRPLQVGDQVHVASVKLDGEILSIDPDAGEAEVQVGGFRMTVDLRELRRRGLRPGNGRGATETAPSYAATSIAPRVIQRAPAAAADVSMQLDMRGMRAHEIEALLDRYLNDAYLGDLSEVRLVHGKGTGTLRKIVRDILAAHPLVASYAPGVDGEGGEGVTVAKLRRR
ncbi:MAG: endonuclease MutS2 [Chloroflexota bacterium]|nr:endonuclease MutS2 [Chloroflexota bacterium]